MRRRKEDRGKWTKLMLVCLVALLIFLFALHREYSTFTLISHDGANKDPALVETVFDKYQAWRSTGYLQDGLVNYHKQVARWKTKIPWHPTGSLVFTCGARSCGGWADRQEGIVAAFLLACLTGRRFYIQYEEERCQLTDYYIPNDLDWRFPDYMKSKLVHAQILVAYDEAAFRLGEHVATHNISRMMTKDVVVFSTNQDFTRYLIHNEAWESLTWAQGMERPQIYTAVWERLFRLSPALQLGLRTFLHQLYIPRAQTLHYTDVTYRSVKLSMVNFSLPYYMWHASEGDKKPNENTGRQMRYTLVCGQFRMKRNPSMPQDKPPHDTLNVTPIWTYLRSHNDSKHYRLFVATDSEEIRTQARKLFPDTLIDNPGPIIHSGLAGERLEVCDGLKKTVLDQLALASCDISMRGYKTHLGAISAYWRGAEKRLLCFNATALEPCSPSDKGFHWGPEYTPGLKDHWIEFMEEIKQANLKHDLEEN